jgi:sporulation protein YlmC with PRC-barrel domain
MKAERLKGMAVVSIEDGTCLGRIAEVLFDTRKPHIAGFRVEAGDQALLLPFEQVRSLGVDAVTIPSTAVAQAGRALTAAEAQPSLRDLAKLKVVDEAGTYLGAPREIEISEADGCLTTFEVHQGGVLGIGGQTQQLTAADIRSIGADVMVVRAPAVPAS